MKHGYRFPQQSDTRGEPVIQHPLMIRLLFHCCWCWQGAYCSQQVALVKNQHDFPHYAVKPSTNIHTFIRIFMVLNMTEIYFFLRQNRLPFGSHHSPSSSHHHRVMSMRAHTTQHLKWNPCFFVVVIHTYTVVGRFSQILNVFVYPFCLWRRKERDPAFGLSRVEYVVVKKPGAQVKNVLIMVSDFCLINIGFGYSEQSRSRVHWNNISFLLEYHEYTNTYEYVCKSCWRWWHNLLWNISHKKYMIFDLTGENILFF